VLAIVEVQPSETELAALTSALDLLRRDAVAAGDLCVVTRGTAAAPTPEPPVEVYVGLDPAGERLEVETRRRRDLVVEFSVCRAHGRSLAGKEARELIGEVPDEWVVDVGDEVLATWRRQDYDPAMAAFMVLTACRIWRFAEERVHCSKHAAGLWALQRDPSLTVVQSRSTKGPSGAEVKALLRVKVWGPGQASGRLSGGQEGCRPAGSDSHRLQSAVLR
jgi:hypothetical protein